MDETDAKITLSLLFLRHTEKNRGSNVVAFHVLAPTLHTPKYDRRIQLHNKRANGMRCKELRKKMFYSNSIVRHVIIVNVV